MVCKQTATLGAEAMGTVREDEVMAPLFLSLCLEHAWHDETVSCFILVSQRILFPSEPEWPCQTLNHMLWFGCLWTEEAKNGPNTSRSCTGVWIIHVFFANVLYECPTPKESGGGGMQVIIYFTGTVSSSPDCDMFVTATTVTAFPQTESMLGAEKGELLLKLSPHSKVLNPADPCLLTARACSLYQATCTPLVEQVRRSQIGESVACLCCTQGWDLSLHSSLFLTQTSLPKGQLAYCRAEL